jgi:Uri superfamily endonuclease
MDSHDIDKTRVIPSGDVVKPQPGTYVLVLSSAKAALIQVGKLGSLQLGPGIYVYVGSAHGPGGLRARLAHHLEATARPHWHIDYLRAHVAPEEVWYCYDRISWEHGWAYCLGTMSGASVPLARFGSSDCVCESHLFFFGSRPSRAAFARRLAIFERRHPPVLLVKANYTLQEWPPDRERPPQRANLLSPNAVI